MVTFCVSFSQGENVCVLEVGECFSLFYDNILKSSLFIFAPASSCPLLLVSRCRALYGVPPAVRHWKSMKLVDSLNFMAGFS